MKRNYIITILQTLVVLMCMIVVTTSCSSGGSEENNEKPIPTPTPDTPTPPTPSGSDDVTYELNPSATFIPETVTQQLVSVDTVACKLVLPLSSQKPEVGQTLIFNTTTKDLPDGLLAKVKSVTESSDGYVVTYENAELKDAFKDIDVPEQYISLGEYVQHVYDANGNEIDFNRVATTRSSGVKEFVIEVPRVSWPIMNGVELTPKMTINLLMRYVMQFGDYEMSYAGVKLDADVTIGADLNVKLDEKTLGEKRWRVLQLSCTSIPVPAPPAIPVLWLKPAIGIDIVAKADGKITIEASFSYKRTMHASMIYQKGAGLSGDFKLDPEASDALKYSFGPKFEGGVGFGPSLLTWIGVYGQAFCLRGTLDMLTKMTISGKLDLTAFIKEKNSLLTPFTFNPSSHPDFDEMLLESLKTARYWNFQALVDLLLNMSFVENMNFKIIALGKTLSTLILPEVSVPFFSTPIIPQLLIDEKDFFDFKNNNVTLTLHHTKQSVLDGLTEFRAEFTPVDKNGSPNTKKSIVKYFDFNDEKRNLLVAEIAGADVKSTTTAALDDECNYDMVVYMSILNMDFPIFTMKINTEKESPIRVIPDKVTLNVDGDAQEVKIEKGSYKYCDAEVLPPFDTWLSAKCNNEGIVSITAKPNMSFDPRHGEVECWASNKEKPQPAEKKKVTVFVTQEPVTGVDWDPKELKFKAVGGSEKISFTFGGFKRFGATVHEEGHGWCGVSAANGKLTITVQPNDTEESRECIVDAYVTNSQNPTDEEKLIMPITVYQEAPDLYGEMSALPDIFNIPADGAVEYIQVKYPTDQIKYYGYSIQDDASGWVRAAVSNDYQSKNRYSSQVFFTVAPNTTGQARKGTIKMYVTNNKDNPENERVYMNSVTITQAAGPYTTMANIFCGKWFSDQTNGTKDNLGEYWCVRLNVYPDGTFTREYMFTKNGGQDGKWYTNAAGTYTVTGFTQNRLNIHVDVELNYKDNNGETQRETSFFEVYPHFMRHGGFYLDRLRE